MKLNIAGTLGELEGDFVEDVKALIAKWGTKLESATLDTVSQGSVNLPTGPVTAEPSTPTAPEPTGPDSALEGRVTAIETDVKSILSAIEALAAKA